MSSIECQDRYDVIKAMITPFCDQYLDDEYKALCIHALDKLARKKSSPLMKGRENIWAGGIVYAVAQNCFLIGNRQDVFTARPKYHLTSDQICKAFGGAPGGVTSKAKLIRELLNMSSQNNEWVPSYMHATNTMFNQMRKALGIKLPGQR